MKILFLIVVITWVTALCAAFSSHWIVFLILLACAMAVLDTALPPRK